MISGRSRRLRGRTRRCAATRELSTRLLGDNFLHRPSPSPEGKGGRLRLVEKSFACGRKKNAKKRNYAAGRVRYIVRFFFFFGVFRSRIPILFRLPRERFLPRKRLTAPGFFIPSNSFTPPSLQQRCNSPGQSGGHVVGTKRPGSGR